MNSIQILREQLKSAHELLEGTVADLDEKSAHFTDTGKALPAGAAYAHAVLSEDMVVADMLAHKTSLSSDNTKTGLSEPMPSFSEWEKHEAWTKSVKVDLAKLKAFAQQVYKATDDYLSSLKEEDLDKEIEIPGMGKNTVIYVLNNFLILHLANLTGEISAAKGLQGLKGYPW